jgi:hypothetical protein
MALGTTTQYLNGNNDINITLLGIDNQGLVLGQ